jgi:hypothetical protein
MKTYDIVIHSVVVPARHLRNLGGGFGRRRIDVTDPPFYAAARALLDRGASSLATLRMRHQGSATISMTGVIGVLAKLTVVEDDGGPKVARW